MVEEQDDKQLVCNVQKAGCQESLKELIIRHSALCINVCQRYANALSASGVCMDDVIKEKDYIIYKSAISYNPEKGAKFSTWVGNHSRYQCLNKINGSNHYVSMDDEKLNYFIENSDTSSSEPDAKETSEYIFSILSQLKDKRIETVFRMRYFSPEATKTSWSAIADSLGVSTQTAINLHSRGAEVLKTKLRSKNFFDTI